MARNDDADEDDDAESALGIVDNGLRGESWRVAHSLRHA